MQFKWIIESKDLESIRNLAKIQEEDEFVKHRINRNILGVERPEANEENLWHAMMACLLTTQQKSGPNSPVNKLLSLKPFPLNIYECKKSLNLRKFISETISLNKGIRRNISISEQACKNYEWLEAGGWTKLIEITDGLLKNENKLLERKFARTLAENISGFGPKQARNFLQSLGLTKYEIPIDSRVIKWLNKFWFPINISGSALSDQNYYEFILDAIIALCEQCNVYPCVLDAVIFSSMDKNKWTKGNIIW
jgi:hypothetical protein